MPPRVKVTRAEIIHAAVALVRVSGPQALNARALARQLGTSTQPIFSNFESMDALRSEVARYADTIYQDFFQAELDKQLYPPYKASGMAYIRFARQEKELFHLQFMRSRQGMDPADRGTMLYDSVISLVQKGAGLPRDAAERLHFEMWACVHGVATMLATDYMELSDAQISELLTDVYQGLLHRFRSKEGEYEEYY